MRFVVAAVALPLVIGCGAAAPGPPASAPSATGQADSVRPGGSKLALTVSDPSIAPATTPAVPDPWDIAEREGRVRARDDWTTRKPVVVAARAALRKAAESARSCRQYGEERGSPKVRVTFDTEGDVTFVSVDPPFDQGAVGRCVLEVVGKVRIPAFSGDPVEVSKSIHID